MVSAWEKMFIEGASRMATQPKLSAILTSKRKLSERKHYLRRRLGPIVGRALALRRRRRVGIRRKLSPFLQRIRRKIAYRKLARAAAVGGRGYLWRRGYWGKGKRFR